MSSVITDRGSLHRVRELASSVAEVFRVVLHTDASQRGKLCVLDGNPVDILYTISRASSTDRW